MLVSSCPGGVASNIVCFIAKANVALSVAMTTVSTLLAVVLTPLLIKTILGTAVPVSGWALFLSTVQVCAVSYPSFLISVPNCIILPDFFSDLDPFTSSTYLYYG